ncbi:DUF4124 domain-containing protein [Hydrogenophaga sp. A37]|nr:DUF4124 domain-containing protein [Hydrogenophaga sp. A37]
MRLATLGCALVALSSAALAQDKSKAGIYSCIDGKGRRITSDRPIVDCLDREQRELSNSGVVKRVLPPSYTADERARLDAQKKVEEAERSRVAEEKRRDRALLIRYPNQAVHDKERTDALAQIDDVIGAVKKRGEELVKQRRDIDIELEFYQNDVTKVPSWLKRKIEDNAEQIQIQTRFLNDQGKEKQRVNTRFDEELAKLKMLWSTR